jgi:TonB-linked SusC/RagA family outer membrane protein
MALLAGWAGPLTAQNAVLRGMITDSATGRALEGAVVSILGTAIRTQAKADGGFAFAQVSPGQVKVRAQMIGYSPMERTFTVPDSGEVTADFALAPKPVELQELVAIGYGTQARSDVSSAVSSVGGEALTPAVAGLDGGMQGKVPGVQVIQNAGNPGNGMTVRVRGSSSISAGNQPLYVVDGVPMIAEDYSQLDLGGQGVSGVTGIPAGDIESIDVLKDAAATAIYGSRGSNGVVMITTKRGKAGKAQVSLDAYTGPQWASSRIAMMNSTQYVKYFNEGAKNDGYGPNYVFTPGVDDQVNTDWQNAVLREAPIGNVDVGISGGSDKLTYRVSGNYFDQTGIVVGSAYQRLAGRINLDFVTSDKLSFTTSLALSGEDDQRIENDNSGTGLITNAIGEAPIYPVKQPNGQFFGKDNNSGFQYPNPAALGTLNSAAARTNRVLGNVEGRYEFGGGVGFTSRFGLDMIDVKETQYESPKVQDTYAVTANGVSKRSYSAGNRYVFDNFVDFDKIWKQKHSLSLTGGASLEHTNNELNFIRGEGLANDKFTQVRNAANPTSFDGTTSRTDLVSFFGRANYTLSGKYLFGASIRADGSSRFGPNERWGVFPAASAAWVMSRESFMRNAHWLDDLKLRASYGLTGNQPLSYYPYQALVGSANYGTVPGLAPSSLPNPDLKWESTAQLDLGIDLTMFKGRVGLTADWYNKDTKDLLLDRPISTTSGFASIYSNVGNMTNHGVDLGLNTVNIDNRDPRGFHWLMGLSLSFNKNEVTKLANNEPFDVDINRVQVGHPLGEFYTLKFLGVDPQTGNAIFKDVNGDGQINSDDRVFVGSPQPNYTGGLTNTFTWKGADLSFFASFSQGNKVYNAMRIYSASGGYYYDNQFADQLSRWQKPGDKTNVPRASYDGTSGADLVSSRFIEDGSYFRMQDITLGYQLPANWAASGWFSSLRLYTTVRNAFIITNYSGYDPDVNSNGAAVNVGLANDFYSYPQERTFILGVQAGW